MSVDRSGRAWVLYSSGEIFWVSTVDATCQRSSFTKGQAGFELFGMGFVSDSPGSAKETLFVAGASASQQNTGTSRLGKIDPATLQLSSLGSLATAMYSPELTGTGDAELYGYYPGSANTFVAKINKENGQSAQTWGLPPLDNDVRAWAFAHWGGQFYIFVTTIDLFDPFSMATNSQVWLLNPKTSSATKILDNLPYIIVGAGVSTCAPVLIP